MYYIFYETINTVNGKRYYGAHKTKDLDDGYLGSGKTLKAAIKKYGKAVFIRRTIEEFSTENRMYLYEKARITGDVVKNPKTYNETLGGRGGFSHIDNLGDKNPMKRKDVRMKVVATKKKNGSYHTEACVAARKKNLKAAVKINTGSKRPMQAEVMRELNREFWKDKEVMRDYMSSCFLITSPTGQVFETNRLEDWCKVNNLPYTTVWKTSVDNVSVKRGKAKGWKCTKVQS